MTYVLTIRIPEKIIRLMYASPLPFLCKDQHALIRVYNGDKHLTIATLDHE